MKSRKAWIFLVMALVGGFLCGNAEARVSSPGNVTFGSPTAPSTTAVFDSTGTFVIQRSTFDGAKTSLGTVTVTVLGASVSPVVSIGTGTVIAGNGVDIYVGLSAGTTGIASLQFDVACPVGVSSATVRAGVAALASGKTVVLNHVAGGCRVLVSGINQTVIGPPGELLIINFRVDPALASGTQTLAISNIAASDPAGLSVPITGTNGAIIVTANAAPVVTLGPNQTITLPASATLTGTATDDGAPNPPGALTNLWSVL